MLAMSEQKLPRSESLVLLGLVARLGALEDPRARLRAIARLRGLSLGEIALRCGLNYQRAESILNSRRNPSPEELAVLTTAILDGITR
jgi:hypothetical protein